MDKVEDVISFTKIVPKIGFFIEYRDSKDHLKIYYPDFIILTNKNEYWIVETKGREDVDVEYKDRRAKLWCKDATKLTTNKWFFKRIDQEYFEKYKFKSFYELIEAIPSDFSE